MYEEWTSREFFLVQRRQLGSTREESPQKKSWWPRKWVYFILWASLRLEQPPKWPVGNSANIRRLLATTPVLNQLMFHTCLFFSIFHILSKPVLKIQTGCVSLSGFSILWQKILVRDLGGCPNGFGQAAAFYFQIHLGIRRESLIERWEPRGNIGRQ